MLSYPVVVGISIVAVLAFSTIVYALTGSVISIFVIFVLAAIILYVLTTLGYLKVDGDLKDFGLDLSTEPTPSVSKSAVPIITQTATNLEANEVFYVSGNNYTYDDSRAVCAAYESELASYDQLMQAHSQGADWCGYGWTQGGMALYPTQESTWKNLQGEVDNKKRTACGRPGINGGYFDPNTKFGVNCYGVKPENTATPTTATALDKDQSEFNKAVAAFKAMISNMSISSFNKSNWSQPNMISTK